LTALLTPPRPPITFEPSHARIFLPESEGYLADPALLDRLVTERSASLVADLEGQGWAWAEVHFESDYWEALEKYNTLRPVPVDLDPALLAEADKLRAEFDAIDQASEDEEPSELAERRRDEIENRLDEIEAGKTEFTSEQKSQAGVIVTIGHNGRPVYHCGLVVRRAKGPSTNGDESNSSEQEKEGLSAALVQDLTTQQTAALRATLSVRPDIALIAITHNLAAQIFYDQTYLLPSSLTVRTDAHADGFDLRAAAESEAAKTKWLLVAPFDEAFFFYLGLNSLRAWYGVQAGISQRSQTISSEQAEIRSAAASMQTLLTDSSYTHALSLLNPDAVAGMKTMAAIKNKVDDPLSSGVTMDDVNALGNAGKTLHDLNTQGKLLK